MVLAIQPVKVVFKQAVELLFLLQFLLETLGELLKLLDSAVHLREDQVLTLLYFELLILLFEFVVIYVFLELVKQLREFDLDCIVFTLD